MLFRSQVDVDLDAETVSVETPAHATLLRLESCYGEGDQHYCKPWNGTYELYDDGELVLEPYATEFDAARVTWLVIE